MNFKCPGKPLLPPSTRRRDASSMPSGADPWRLASFQGSKQVWLEKTRGPWGLSLFVHLSKKYQWFFDIFLRYLVFEATTIRLPWHPAMPVADPATRMKSTTEDWNDTGFLAGQTIEEALKHATAASGMTHPQLGHLTGHSNKQINSK